MRTECGLSKKQAAIYQKAVADLAERLQTADGIARRGLVLVDAHADEANLQSSRRSFSTPVRFRRPRAASSIACDNCAQQIAERQEKVLVFTQFQALTQPLADFLADDLRPAGAGAARRHAGRQARGIGRGNSSPTTARRSS